MNDSTNQQINDSTVTPQWTKNIRPVSGWFDIHLGELTLAIPRLGHALRASRFRSYLRTGHSRPVMVPDPAGHDHADIYRDFWQSCQNLYRWAPFKEVLGRRFSSICHSARGCGLHVLKHYISSTLKPYKYVGWENTLHFLKGCLWSHRS